MAHIKEPKGVDFIIQSEPLTNEIRLEITDFIKAYQGKEVTKKTRQKGVRSKKVMPTH